jgi:hypothetical protein
MFRWSAAWCAGLMPLQRYASAERMKMEDGKEGGCELERQMPVNVGRFLLDIQDDEGGLQ